MHRRILDYATCTEPDAERDPASMDAAASEITMRDLLAWEPRLLLVAPREADPARPAALEREVDWVMTARSSSPMLPMLRGGELIILPQRVVQESGLPFQRLVNEITMQPVAGVLTDVPADVIPSTRLIILRATTIGPDLESELNRLLTTRRGDLLRTAADVDRLIAEHNGRAARPGELIHALASRLALHISILNESGAALFTSGPGITNVAPASRDPEEWLSASLRGDRTVWVGPIAPEARALGRMVLQRVATGIQRSLDADASSAPHGTARTAALNAVLQPAAGTTRDEIAEQAFRAGIAPGRQLRVVLLQSGEASRSLRRHLVHLGDAHEAGVIDGRPAVIMVAAPTTRPEPTITVEPTGPWLAVSGPVSSARDLPEAARQARYVAALLDRRLLHGPVARFTDDAQLGAYRLLYEFWGTPALERYVERLLGELRREDRRGMLLDTLRVYLEHGGSQRPTAERLGIHRNTLGYRLRHIRDVIGGDLDDPQLRLSLQLALTAAELPPTS